MDLQELMTLGADLLPGQMGIEFLESEGGRMRARMEVQQKHLAPSGFLHAGAVVSLADSACGYGCFLSLPEDATGFTTIELKSNFLRTAASGTLECEARLVHGGRSTQVWDATVTGPDGATLALFRCTQLMLRR
jgi:1,4-dihydroxy-2-naphthoyl-CoA hydrolase